MSDKTKSGRAKPRAASRELISDESARNLALGAIRQITPNATLNPTPGLTAGWKLAPLHRVAAAKLRTALSKAALDRHRGSNCVY